MRTDPRVEATKARILDAALDAFVLDGYTGTSTDAIAAAAAASKQTVYKYFGDKEGLFRAIVTDLVGRVHGSIVRLDIDDYDDGEQVVRGLSRLLMDSILDRRVQRFRRLVIAEAARFPDLGRAYYEGAFEHTIGIMAELLAGAGTRGWLQIDEPRLAANHLAGLLLWIPSNRMMMTGRLDTITDAELESVLEAGIRVFLAAYGR
jgi:TetR/AcrR family transcriptional regulator, mexJK operon transcriptional repressor